MYSYIRLTSSEIQKLFYSWKKGRGESGLKPNKNYINTFFIVYFFLGFISRVRISTMIFPSFLVIYYVLTMSVSAEYFSYTCRIRFNSHLSQNFRVITVSHKVILVKTRNTIVSRTEYIYSRRYVKRSFDRFRKSVFARHTRHSTIAVTPVSCTCSSCN